MTMITDEQLTDVFGLPEGETSSLERDAAAYALSEWPDGRTIVDRASMHADVAAGATSDTLDPNKASGNR